MQTVKEDRLQKMFIGVNKMFSEYEFDKYMMEEVDKLIEVFNQEKLNYEERTN